MQNIIDNVSYRLYIHTYVTYNVIYILSEIAFMPWLEVCDFKCEPFFDKVVILQVNARGKISV